MYVHHTPISSPYAGLEELIDTSYFDELNREITRGLAQVETSYTGGTLSDQARAMFPKTVAFVESLPMLEMGRVVIFGRGSMRLRRGRAVRVSAGARGSRPWT